MTWRIDRSGLHQLVEQACDRIEATPMPDDFRGLPGADAVPEGEWLQVWLAAGIATQIADVLNDQPEGFVIQPRRPRATSNLTVRYGGAR